jgi:hypothetical protein
MNQITCVPVDILGRRVGICPEEVLPGSIPQPTWSGATVDTFAPDVATRRDSKDVIVDIDPSPCELICKSPWENVVAMNFCNDSSGSGGSPSDC